MDDLIYREDAIKAACKGFCHPGIFCPDTGCKELEPIKNLPTVDAIPVEWVEDLIRRLRGETAAASSATSTQLEKMLRIWRDEGCHTMPH